MMNIKEIAAAYWTNTEAINTLADIAQDILDAQAPGTPPMGTTKLLRAILPDANDLEAKSIINKLQRARDNGRMEGYFSRGKKGMFGHLSVHWHSRVKPAFTEEQRRENQRKLGLD